jgi:hypothetical protein
LLAQRCAELRDHGHQVAHVGLYLLHRLLLQIEAAVDGEDLPRQAAADFFLRPRLFLCGS